MLLNSNPNLYNQCIDILKEAVIETEIRANQTKGSFGFRPIRLDDVGINGSTWENTYEPKMSNSVGDIGESRQLLSVPASNAWVYFGWFTDTDLGINSDFSFYHEGVLKSKISSTFVYNCENPAHTFIDIQNIISIRENSRIEFRVYNDNKNIITANVIPILYRIAHLSALNLFKKSDRKVNNDIKIPSQNSDISVIKDMLNAYLNPTPMDIVRVKDENNIEHDEIRAKLDPNYKSWIETLKNNEVCGFCGSEIERVFSSNYCNYCGVHFGTKMKRQVEDNKKPTSNEGISIFMNNITKESKE